MNRRELAKAVAAAFAALHLPAIGRPEPDSGTIARIDLLDARQGDLLVRASARDGMLAMHWKLYDGDTAFGWKLLESRPIETDGFVFENVAAFRNAVIAPNEPAS